MKTKEIDKVKKKIRLLAIAILEYQKNGQINPYLMNDLNNIILEEEFPERRWENKI